MVVSDLANELPLEITFFKVRNMELEFGSSYERTESIIGAYITGRNSNTHTTINKVYREDILS